jgi:Rrf2 family protein
MLFTKTTEYALRVLICIAKSDSQLLSANHLHEKLDIPYKYLTRIMTDLSKKNLLLSVKGRDGGFKLIRPSEQIMVSDIIDAVEGMERFNSCILGFQECSSDHPCAMHSVWEQNKINLLHTFKTTSLFDMIQQEFQKK